MNKLTASYLAGLIDGEGSLEIRKRKKPECKNGIMYVARIRVALTDKPLIYWLKDSFGGWVSNRIGKGKCRDSYAWCLNYGGNKKFLDKVLPYLKLKRERGEVIKEFLKTFSESSYKIVENKLGYGTGLHKELKDEIVKKREELYQQMKKLNIRGK